MEKFHAMSHKPLRATIFPILPCFLPFLHINVVNDRKNCGHVLAVSYGRKSPSVTAEIKPAFWHFGRKSITAVISSYGQNILFRP